MLSTITEVSALLFESLTLPHYSSVLTVKNICRSRRQNMWKFGLDNNRFSLYNYEKLGFQESILHLDRTMFFITAVQINLDCAKYWDNKLIFSEGILWINMSRNIRFVSRDSAVGIATGYGLDDWEVGVRVTVGQGREAGHSPPTSAEVKKMWIYTSTSPYAFMA
jgi:hypothetical protein